MKDFSTDALLNQSGLEFPGNIKPQQHNRLYLWDIAREFRAGLMNRAGLVWNWIKLRIAETWRLYAPYERFMAEMKDCFGEDIGLDRSTYYRIIGKIEDQGYVKFHRGLSMIERLPMPPIPSEGESQDEPSPQTMTQGPAPVILGVVAKMRLESQKCDQEALNPLLEEVCAEPSNSSSDSSSNDLLMAQ